MTSHNITRPVWVVRHVRVWRGLGHDQKYSFPAHENAQGVMSGRCLPCQEHCGRGLEVLDVTRGRVCHVIEKGELDETDENALCEVW